MSLYVLICPYMLLYVMSLSTYFPFLICLYISLNRPWNSEVYDTERDADAGVPSVQQVVLLCLYVLFSQGLGLRVEGSLQVLICPYMSLYDLI